MKKNIFLLFLLFPFGCVLSQKLSVKYDVATAAFDNKEYASAYKLFKELEVGLNSESEFLAAAKFYQAESLYNMGELDAAAVEYENYVRKFYWTNFRTIALFRLGNLYYLKSEWENSRKPFLELIDAYPEDENVGASLFLIGSSFTEEGKFDEAERFFLTAIEKRKGNRHIDYSIYSLAGVYETTGDYKSAISYYDRLLTFYNESKLAPYAKVRIGVCYFASKDYENAIIELNAPIIDKLPKEILQEAKYVLANSYYRLGEYSNAEKYFLTLLNNFPEYPFTRQIKYSLAWAYFQQAKYDEAYLLFDMLARDRIDTLSINSLYWGAESKRYAGKSAEAIELYDGFLRIYPNHKLAPLANYQIAAVNFERGRLKAAEEYLLHSIGYKEDETSARALILLGEIKLQNNIFEEAKILFDKAVSRIFNAKELSNRAYSGLGLSYFHLKDHDSAIKVLLKLKNDSPDFEPDLVNYYIAESYFQKGDYSRAQGFYRNVSRISPEFASRALFGEAYCFFNLKEYAKATYLYSDFIRNNKKDPNVSDAKLRLADCYYATKNFTEAAKTYREVYLTKDANLENDYAYYQYAQALYKSGNPNDAANEFKNLQTRFPNSKYTDESQYLIGWINFQRGKFKDAIENYNLLILKYPNSPLVPIVYNSIGDSYFNLGDYNAAIESYKRALNDFTNTSYAFDAVTGLQYAYVALKQPDMAIKTIDDLLVQKPGIAFADKIYFKKGEIYYSQRNYDKSVQSFIDFTLKYPSSSLITGANYWIGKSYFNLNNETEALSYFYRAMNGDSKDELASASAIEIGLIYKNGEKYQDALSLYNKAIGKFKGSSRIPELLFEKAMILADKGDLGQAYETFTEIIIEYDGTIFSEKSKLEAGLIGLAINNYEAADFYLKTLAATRIDDIGAKAQYFYGVSLFEQKNINDAINAFSRTINVFGGYEEWTARAYIKLGDCYEKQKNKQKAREMYNVVVKNHKDNDLGKEAQSKLKALK